MEAPTALLSQGEALSDRKGLRGMTVVGGNKISPDPTAAIPPNTLSSAPARPNRLGLGVGIGSLSAASADPSHTIYQHNLESHKKICNAAKYQAMLTALPYYCHNCNGSCAANTCHSITSGNVSEKEHNLDLDQFIQKIHQAYEKVVIDDNNDDKDKSAPIDYSELDDKIRSNVGGGLTAFDRLRHIEQDIALVHHMIENHLLTYRTKPSSIDKKDKQNQQQEQEQQGLLPYICIEFGAGKGLLTQSIAMADYQASCILIERSSNRHKIDRFLIEEDYKIERLRMDIRHCFLPKVPGIINCLPGTQIVAVAKHLCGLASDLAIHSLSHLMGDHYRQHIHRGLAVATCCHHACNAMDYVGWEWLDQCGFHMGEFEFLKKWSGWAHLDRSISSVERSQRRRRGSKRPLKSDGSSNIEEEESEGEREGEDEVEDEHTQPMASISATGGSGSGSGGMNRPVSIAEEDMPMIGKKIKRILDYGRVLYLRNVLKMKVKYLRYCDEKLSPECMVILAWDDNKHQD
eukprot:gene6504-7171_t